MNRRAYLVRAQKHLGQLVECLNRAVEIGGPLDMELSAFVIVCSHEEAIILEAIDAESRDEPDGDFAYDQAVERGEL